MRKSIRSAYDTIEIFDKEVKKFDKSMLKVQKREEDRIEMETRIKGNAGKKLDYFLLPQAAKRVNYKMSRSASAMSAQTAERPSVELAPKGIIVSKL